MIYKLKPDPRLSLLYLFVLMFFILADTNFLFILIINLLFILWFTAISGYKKTLLTVQILIFPIIVIGLLQFFILNSSMEWIILTLLKFIGISFLFNWYLSVVSPDDLTKTLSSFHIPYRYAWQLSTSYRFLPYFVNETKRIYEAQISRGIPLDQGLLIRIKKIPTILIPLLSSTQNHANQFSELLYARNWDPYRKYNPIHPLKWKLTDWILLVILLGFILTFLYLNQ